MPREIKFRGYSTKLKMMVQWDTYFLNNTCVNCSDLISTDTWKVMQYIGLKDKYGKDIYEDDIVKAENWDPSNHVVKFIEGGFCTLTENSLSNAYPTDINHFYSSVGCSIEVIGNIYENPELLEGQE